MHRWFIPRMYLPHTFNSMPVRLFGLCPSFFMQRWSLNRRHNSPSSRECPAQCSSVNGISQGPDLRAIEVRTHPISGRKCRITFSRSLECERGTGVLPPPPPDAERVSDCPFCPANEVMLGDMATFQLPEKTAEQARPFWHS